MLLTPEYLEKLGYSPYFKSEFSTNFEIERNLSVVWSTRYPMIIFYSGVEIFVDYKNNYKVGEFKKLCEGLRIPLKSIDEQLNRISEYGC